MGIATPLSLAASGLSVVGAVLGGSAKAQGDEFEAQQAENAATIGQTTAAQTSTYMNQDLQRQIQNIQAIRASSGVEDTSPTDEAIANNVFARGQQQIGVKVGNINEQVAADQEAASFYTSSASNALIGGLLGGAGSLFGGLGGAYTAAGSPSFASMLGINPGTNM
jgi:hypothetical protein